MLIHRWDESLDEHEWRTFLAEHRFGDLVASGRNRDLAVVVPTQFVLDGDEVVIHLARPNPIWAAIDENDQVMVCVAADWAFIPSSWKAVGDEDPRLGIPTTEAASGAMANANLDFVDAKGAFVGIDEVLRWLLWKAPAR